jgi:uncharacterized protein (TIGR02271 family)
MTTRTITALFDSRPEAESAVERLVQQAGVDRDEVTIVAQEASGASAPAGEDRGFWASLKELFLPEEDRYIYAEGIRRGGTLVTVRADEARLDRAMEVLEAAGAVDLDTREAEWRREGWTGPGAAAGATAATAATVAAGTTTTTGTATTSAAQTGGAEAIPIVEERLRVGKRDVGRGRVRVRSYVVETPVEEQVALRQERVGVERRPVDRPVTDADRQFQERTIEATETAEEAVVSKEARVTEEVVVRKEAEERTETVRDTVRRTEVEVEDERRAGTSTGTPTDPSRDPGRGGA